MKHQSASKHTQNNEEDNRSQYVSRQMEKLNKDSHRREKVKSSKEVPAMKKLGKEKSSNQQKKKSRNSKSKIFDYEDVSHPGANQDRSEERKMTPFSTKHRSSKKRSDTKDPSIPQPETDSKGCLDYYPPGTPSAYSVAIQANQSMISKNDQINRDLDVVSTPDNEKPIQ